jgi:hypothetical protein
MIGTVTVKTAIVSSSSATSFTFVGLEYKVPYLLGVKARDASGYAVSYTDASNSITPKAAAPSTPAAPVVSVKVDGEIDVVWVEPTNTGGASITSYSVQLWKDNKKFGAPQILSAKETTFDVGEDTQTPFTATVQAVNSEGLMSLDSKPSESITAKKATISFVAAPDSPVDQPTMGPPSQNDETPKFLPFSDAPTVNTASGPAPQTGIAVTNPLAGPIRVTLPKVTFSKKVTVASKTATKTIISMSKLTVAKGSKTAFLISSKSRKICTLKGKTVIATKAGTCSIKVTVTSRSGKKKSQTVKLLIQAKPKKLVRR